MIVIPAVDLREGKCVRLLHGEKEHETVYSDNPVEMAKKWVAAGCSRLHIIDLDGAFEGTPKNFKWVLDIKKETGVMVQFGGGIRSMDVIDYVFDSGIDRIILGTIIFEQAGLAQQAFEKYGRRIMVALDVKNGMVAIRGWKDSSGFPLVEALSVVEKLGGEEVIFTDISRDGTLEGVNVRGVKVVMDLTPMKVYASGGVSSVRDIKLLKEIKCPGCIIGKALYDGKLDLSLALEAAAT